LSIFSSVIGLTKQLKNKSDLLTLHLLKIFFNFLPHKILLLDSFAQPFLLRQNLLQILIARRSLEIQGEIPEDPYEIGTVVSESEAGVWLVQLDVFAQIHDYAQGFERFLVQVTQLVVDEKAGDQDAQWEDFGVQIAVAH
jgi:hypothetical protein